MKIDVIMNEIKAIEILRFSSSLEYIFEDLWVILLCMCTHAFDPVFCCAQGSDFQEFHFSLKPIVLPELVVFHYSGRLHRKYSGVPLTLRLLVIHPFGLEMLRNR